MSSRRGRDDSYRWVRSAGQAAQVGTTLVAAIFVGWLIGQALDKWLHTGPWLMLVFTLMGIAAGFIQMYRLVMAISRDEDAESNRRE